MKTVYTYVKYGLSIFTTDKNKTENDSELDDIFFSKLHHTYSGVQIRPDYKDAEEAMNHLVEVTFKVGE